MQIAKSKNIFLTGFMGSGKSTVGNLLSGLLACPFVDFDEIIIQNEQKSIAEIFVADGEPYFRDCETALLKELPQHPVRVYATGGGLVVRDENRQLMEKLGRVVYLQTSWPVLRQRLQQSVARPLINSAKGWDKVENLLSRRKACYECADVIIDTDGLTPLQVANKIVVELTS